MANDIKRTYVGDARGTDDFTRNYYTLRLREQWIYDDEQVSKLPRVEWNDSHHREWKLREQSTRRLLHYLNKKARPLDILEVGCGNGWLSHRLAGIKGANVAGMDIHEQEIAQARRIFGSLPHLEFHHADFLSAGLAKKFGIIVFAASIQYFPIFSDIVEKAFSQLLPGGELHVIDSPFYPDDEISFAASRSQAYFRELNVPQMTSYYYHHAWSDLKNYSYRILYKPSALLQTLRVPQNPFPWICINNSE